eukprot:CAMPEP_0174879764 /NCGR_PEP_ID=MMETSP1114-20130205/83424_1 /TAXON_ID=312471 /ORGANISM="Neobodo designis, Strain CCAP 1951/1" /LENGTH=1351 /DNA_ID=CAMNT_0016115159 /DNA_START=1 /DNA_END=4056 /DNA_ORIENTATION=-
MEEERELSADDLPAPCFVQLRIGRALTQAFRFRVLKAGYTQILLESAESPKMALAVTEDLEKVVLAESHKKDKLQHFDVIAVDEATFKLRPRLCKAAVVSAQLPEGQTLEQLVEASTACGMVVVPWAEAGPNSHFGVVSKAECDERDAEIERKMGDRIGRRKEAVEKIVGDIDAMTVFEFLPAEADTHRWRYKAETMEAQVLEREKGLGDAHHFMFVDARDGYVSVVPWSNAGHSLALVDDKLQFVDSDPLDDMQAFEMVLVDDEPGQFTLVPKKRQGQYIEAQLDGDGRLALVDEPTNFCAFRITAAANSSSRPTSRGTQGDSGRAARIAAVSKIVGDIDAMKAFELVPKAADGICLRAPKTSGEPILATTRRLKDAQQFVFTDLGDGYVSLVPVSEPNFAVEVSADGDGVTIEQGSESALQAFEIVPGEDEGTFTLCPKGRDTFFLEVALDDEDDKRVRLVPEADATNFCELTAVEVDPNASRPATAETDPAAIGRRKEAVEKIVGDIDAMTVFEFLPAEADTHRWRYKAETMEAQVLEREKGLGDAHHFMFVDARDGYVSVVPWSNAGHSLALVDDKLQFVDSDPLDDMQAFEMRLVENEAGQFMLTPKTVAEQYIEAQLDGDGRLALVEDLSNFCTFRVTGAATSTSSRPVSRGTPRDTGREARIAAVSKILGDLDEMLVFEILPSATDELALQAPEETGGTFTAEDRDKGDAQQFVFTDLGDGYVSITPFSAPESAIQLTADRTQVTLQDATSEDDQAFELVLGEDEGTFSLCPKAKDSHFLELALDKDVKRLGLVPEAEATNFCEFKVVEAQDASRPASKKSKKKKGKKDRTPLRLDAVTRIFGASFAESEGAESFVFELAPNVASDLRVTEGAPMAVNARVLRAKHQKYVATHIGGGLVTIRPENAPDAALTIDADQEVGVMQAEEGADEQKFELMVVDAAAASASQNFDRVCFTISCIAHDATIVEAGLDADEPTLRNIPDSEGTNFCEFFLVDHATMAATDEKMERARKAKKRRKMRVAAIESIIEDLEAMEIYEFVPAASERLRLLAQGDGEPLRAAKRNGDDTQQFVFTDAGDGYVNVVTWSASSSVITISADGKTVTQEELVPDSENQMFEVITFEQPGEFALCPASHPDMYLELALDAAEDAQTLRLVPEAEASNFSAFRIEKPADDVTPEVSTSPKAGKKKGKKGPEVDPEVEGRLIDIRKVFGDDWDGRRVKLASGAERGHLLHVADGAIVASDGASTVFTVRDAERGYLALEAEDGTLITFDSASKRAVATPESDFENAAMELVLLEGAEGFCLAPLAHTGTVIEVMVNEAAPFPLTLVPEDEISSFSELLVVDA